MWREESVHQGLCWEDGEHGPSTGFCRLLELPPEVSCGQEFRSSWRYQQCVWYFPIGVTSLCSLIMRPPLVCSSCCSKLVLKWAKPHWNSGRWRLVQRNHFSSTSIRNLSMHAFCGVSMWVRVCVEYASQQYKSLDINKLVQELCIQPISYHLCHITKGDKGL